MSESKTFNSTQEEIEYWKAEANRCSQSLRELQAEYDEFKTSSEELEAELEAELNQSKSKVNELTVVNQKLESELHILKERYDSQNISNHRQISELETKLTQAESYTAVLQKYIRELEQNNDDLDRAKRAAVVSLEDFELRLNQAIERNAFLESELDDKEDLAVCVQRLKDETRDLKHELAVHDLKTEESVEQGNPTSEVKPPQSSAQPTGRVSEVINQSRHSGGGGSSDTSKHVSVKPSPRVNYGTSPSSFTQASRISALHIVGDMLRRVSALESKLSACRTLSHGMTLDNQSSYSLGLVGARMSDGLKNRSTAQAVNRSMNAASPSCVKIAV